MAGHSTGGGGFGAASITYEIAPGILQAVDVFTESDLFGAFETFVAVHVNLGGNDDDNRQYFLTSGYITKFAGLHYEGFVELPPNSILYVHIRGNIDPVIRVVDHRLQRPPGKELIQIAKSILSPA